MRTWIITKYRRSDCEERKKGRYYLLLLLSLLAIVVCSAIGIYAFLANEVSKIDVSAPDPGGPVIVPENYQNLLVLDIASNGDYCVARLILTFQVVKHYLFSNGSH